MKCNDGSGICIITFLFFFSLSVLGRRRRTLDMGAFFFYYCYDDDEGFVTDSLIGIPTLHYIDIYIDYMHKCV